MKKSKRGHIVGRLISNYRQKHKKEIANLSVNNLFDVLEN